MRSRLIGRVAELARLHDLVRGDEASAVAISGVCGVGRTRLVEELVARVEVNGTTVVRIVGTASARSIQFGAVAHLLEDGPADASVAAMRDALRTVRRAARSGELLVAVDDAHLLDDGSWAVIERLIGDPHTAVVLSVRADERGRPEGAQMFRDVRLQWVELAPLDRGESDQLVAEALGEDVSAPVRRVLWETSGGRPLYLRALLDPPVGQGGLRREEGVWRWDGLPSTSAVFDHLVADQLGDMGKAQRDALELVSLGQPLPSDVALTATEPTALVDIEERGLICSDPADGELRVAFALLALILEARLGGAKRTTLAARLRDAWADSARDDAVARSAIWALEADTGVEHDAALEGARFALARFEFERSERLARAAIASRPDLPEAHRVLAETMRLRGRGRDAADAYGAAGSVAADDDTRVAIALARSENESLLMDNPDAALRVLRDALAEVEDPEAVRALSIGLVFQASLTGAFDDVVAAGPLALGFDNDSETELGIANVTVFAQAMTLRIDGVVELAERALELAEAHGADAPLSAQQLGASRVLATAGAGRLREAWEMGTRDLVAARAAGAPTSLALVGLAYVGCLTGDLVGAVDAAIEAVTELDELDPLALMGTAAGIGAIAALQAGRLDEVDGLADRAAAIDREVGGPAARFIGGRVEVWRNARAHRLAHAASLTAATGVDSCRANHRLWGAPALHDAVRFGFAEYVVDDLVDLDKEVSTGLVELMRGHAEALVDRDVARLSGAADDFAATGAMVLAAEADAQAAGVASERGDLAAAAVSATRARLRWRSCTGAPTPALESCPRGLTERELEIALAVSRGGTSREVGETMFVSTRTIDNHLRSAYRKLDVSGREELSALLADL